MTNNAAIINISTLKTVIKDIPKYNGKAINKALEMAIKALEQEPCEDAIGRQAAIDAMYNLCDTGETLNENPWRDNPHIDAITDTIDDLPPVIPQPRWIPVSERLPKDKQEILFSTKTGGVHSGKYQDDNSANQWYSHMSKCRVWNNVVTAWMPLPEPYGPQESEG